MKPTNIPLTVKEFDEALCGRCAGCGCSCGYILYCKDGIIADLYGHPADPNGVGSLCTKGITYIQATDTNPLRLKEAYLKEGQSYKEVSLEQALTVAKEKTRNRRIAFLLDRWTGLEEYVLASSITELVFTDALYLPFKASSVKPQDWKDSRFILSVEADPVFSEVMSTRWIVDAVEKGAYLYALSSRYSTLCAKAKESHLVPPYLSLELLNRVLNPEEEDPKASFIKRSLKLIKPSLVLIGSCLLSSPFREHIITFLKEARRKFGIDYSIVGDVMPFPSKSLKEINQEEFDVLIVFGNILRFLKDEELESLRSKFVIHFTMFPNFTSHHAHLIIPVKNFTEREFINYRHGFGFLSYSPKSLSREKYIHPYEFLSQVFGLKVDLKEFLLNYGVDYQELKEVGQADLKLPTVEAYNPHPYEELKKSIYIYTDNTLVEELGHWYTWTHDMEKYQMAYMNERTAREMGIEDSLNLRGYQFKVIITPNIADGVIFIPSSYEEYQPFHPGISVGRFLKEPYNRFEVIK